jgi:molybdate transport system ATP-binding protein
VADLSIRVHVALRAFALDVDLTVGAEALAIVGPSGAGKTTLLRCVSGLRRPGAGRIALGSAVWFDADRGIDLPPERRSVGLVPQHYALFPHMTVRDNVGFGGRDRVDELLRRLRIDHLAAERPARLSGGERQRVALARALAREPDVLLLDEPLAALDPHTRTAIRGELLDLLGRLSLPTILVTHDFRDAAALADRIAVVLDGRVHQTGSTTDLLERPADAFVAAFTGANLLTGIAEGREVVLEGGVRIRTATDAHGPVGIAIQPWEITVAGAAGADGRDSIGGADGRNSIAGAVEAVVASGDRVRVRIAGLEAEVDAAAAAGLRRGAVARAVFDPASARVVTLRDSPPWKS